MHFSLKFRKHVLANLHTAGFEDRFVSEIAMAKWERGLLPLPCRLEVIGKAYGLEDGCNCLGCRERRLLAYFTAVYRQHGEGPENL